MAESMRTRWTGLCCLGAMVVVGGVYFLFLRKPEKTVYGGYRGYFADPDGHVWEIVTAPGFGFTDDGRLILSD